jgi:hypothetical protein
MRELRLIFGFWTAASVSVAIFMGGLGAGLLLGRRANLASRPLAFYGWLELAIAGPLAVVPLFLGLVLVAYIGPRYRWRLKPMAMVTDPASIARYLAGVGEATQVPAALPAVARGTGRASSFAAGSQAMRTAAATTAWRGRPGALGRGLGAVGRGSGALCAGNAKSHRRLRPRRKEGHAAGGHCRAPATAPARPGQRPVAT